MFSSKALFVIFSFRCIINRLRHCRKFCESHKLPIIFVVFTLVLTPPALLADIELLMLHQHSRNFLEKYCSECLSSILILVFVPVVLDAVSVVERAPPPPNVVEFFLNILFKMFVVFVPEFMLVVFSSC